MPQENNAELGWSQDVWDRIEQAAADQHRLVSASSMHIPSAPPQDPNSRSISSDIVTTAADIAEGAELRYVEAHYEFFMYSGQIEAEEEIRTAVTLVSNFAAKLAQVQDVRVFQGNDATLPAGLVGVVEYANSTDPGLGVGVWGEATAPRPDPWVPGIDEIAVDDQTVPGTETTWEFDQYEAIVLAVTELVGKGFGPPYVAIVPTAAYADAHRTVSTVNNERPIDSINPYLNKAYYPSHLLGTRSAGAGEDAPRQLGFVISMSGLSIDLAVPVETTVRFHQADKDGRYSFRIHRKFAFRLRAANVGSAGVVQLQFTTNDA